MSTTKQKEAARKNLKKARAAQSVRTKGPSGGSKRTKAKSQGMSTAEKNDLKRSDFAFPKERKEPIVDAKHVRNAISRFDQVEGVSDAERDEAWKRIRRAAKRFDIEVSEKSWRDLFTSGKDSKTKS